MQGFRAQYIPHRPASEALIAVHVIGYAMPFQEPVNVPAGIPHIFLFCFHDTAEVKTDAGWEELAGPAWLACAPHTPVQHRLRAAPFLRSWMRCSGPLVAETLSRNRIPFGRLFGLSSLDPHLDHLLRIHEEIQHPRGADPENVIDLFRLWIRHLRRQVLETDAQGVPSAFLRARHFIETHYLHAPRLQAIARAAGLSASHLCRGFRRHFGVTPNALAADLRLHHARELLADVDLSIGEIAVQSGHSDVYYFSRLFKQRMGLTPSAYRKRILAGARPAKAAR